MPPHSDSMDHWPPNSDGFSPISVIVSDADKTLIGSLPSNPDQDSQIQQEQSIIDTRDSDSVASTNGSTPSSPSSPIDELCLVPDQVTVYTADCDDSMQLEPKEGPSNRLVDVNDQNHEYPHNHFRHFCSCNRFCNSYHGFRRRWSGPCGPCCNYLESRFYGYGPRHSSRELWRGNSENGDDMPGWCPVQETVPTGVGAGLYNLGNTCFINAILQCFTHTVPLVKALRSCNHSMPCQRGVEGFCVVCTLRNHIELSLTSSGKTISPSIVVDNLKHISSCFVKFQQEDAHEFLQCLLDKLERCCLDPDLSDETSSSRVDNIVERIFGGRLVSKLRCCNCGHFSDKYEPLIDLSLEIEEVETLQSALESFTKVEKIEDVDTKFRCDHCKEEASREKQLMLDQAPSVAALHLKRFKSDGSSIEKIDKHVEFPLELDLNPYTNSSEDCNENQVDLKYQLYAIVVHNGFSPTSGHYFCYVRSSPCTWHKLDDSRVVKVEEERVLSQSAYILFYIREGTPWFSSLVEPVMDCLDRNISNTSPKSVLDGIVTESASYPHLESLDHCQASVNRGDIERSNHSSGVTAVEDDKTNETMNDVEVISTEISDGCGQSGPEVHCNESKGDISMDDVSVPREAMVCHDGISNKENSASLPCAKENTSDQTANRTGRNGVDLPVPPRSTSPDLNFGGRPEARHRTKGDHLKVERSINLKKSKKLPRDHQRMAAQRYVYRNQPRSRRDQLLAAMDSPNNKKIRIGSSPCKQGSPPGSRTRIPRNLVL